MVRTFIFLLALVELALGTDWTASGSINLPRELACADQLNREHFGHFFTDRDLWLSAEEAKDYGLVSRIISSQADI